VNAEARHPVSLDQHAAVMTRRLGIEEAEDQFFGKTTVEMDPAFQVAIHGLAAGQHDQRAHLALGQLEKGVHQGPLDVRRRMRGLPAQPQHRDPLEEPA
jgi:hypothetical protein